MLTVLTLSWALATAIAVDTAARHSFLLWLEHWTGDWRTAFFADRLPAQHPGVVLVVVTDDTLSAFPYRTPVDRAYLARLIEAVAEMKPRAIGLDLLMIRPTEPRKDDKLVDAIRAAAVPIVVAAADDRAQLTQNEADFQAAFLADSGARGGFTNLLTGKDRVVRYLAPPLADGPLRSSFAQALAAPDAPPLTEPRRIAWLLKPKDGSDTFFTVPAHLLALPASATPSPAAAALAPMIAGKIVIIGADLPDLDRHATPLPDWEGEEQAGPVLQAQVVAQILDGRDVVRLRRDLLMALYVGLALLAALVGLRFGGGAITAYSTFAVITVAGLDIALFALTRQFLPFGACVLAIASGVAGGLAIRRLLRFA